MRNIRIITLRIDKMGPNKRTYDQTKSRPFKEFLEKKSDDEIVELISRTIREGLKEKRPEVPGKQALRDITLYHMELILIRNKEYHESTKQYYIEQAKEKTKAWDDIEFILYSPAPIKKSRELANLRLENGKTSDDLDENDEEDTEYEITDPELVTTPNVMYKNIQIKKEKLENHGVPRPRGRAPTGKIWDEVQGCWKD